MYTSTASQHCNIINIMNVNASCLSLFVNRTACAHDEDEIIKILDSNSVGWRVCIEGQPTQQSVHSPLMIVTGVLVEVSVCMR